MSNTDLHISTTGELYSFRPKGADMDARSCVFSALRYGDQPDAVLVTYGIQGKDYFECLLEHWDEITDGVKAVMGYVWKRHEAIYKRYLPRYFKKAGNQNWKLYTLWDGKPYGEDGPDFVWIVCERV